MATPAEIAEALADYRDRCNGNERLRRMLRTWSRVVHFRAVDDGSTFTMCVVEGEITEVAEGANHDPEVVISATSEDLADLFWGDLNPARKYLAGEITVIGSADDLLRIDAMASLLWEE